MNDAFVWLDRDTSTSVHLAEMGHAIGAMAEQGAAAVMTVETPLIKPTGTKKDGAARAPKSDIKAGVGRKGNPGAVLTQHLARSRCAAGMVPNTLLDVFPPAVVMRPGVLEAQKASTCV